ncbi:hypothetical protein HDU97_000494 [Phlyctochytrium planicorne]|nr:hypothetical protein HDU97_000494 [Phlyctochytrium planicorne]
MKERCNALKLSGKDFPEKLDGDSVDFISRIESAYRTLSDMCAEGVEKNRAVIGESLDPTIFFDYFDFAETLYQLEDADEEGEYNFSHWPLHLRYFQVLAHYMAYDNNAGKISAVKSKSLSKWLEVEDFYLLVNWYSPSTAYLQVCRSIVRLRTLRPEFTLPRSMNIPSLLFGDSSLWPQRFFTGTFQGSRYSTRSDYVTALNVSFSSSSESAAPEQFYGIVGNGVNFLRQEEDGGIYFRDAFGDVNATLCEFGVLGTAATVAIHPMITKVWLYKMQS